MNIWIQVGNDDREEVLASCTIPEASIKSLFDCVHEGAEVERRSELVELWCESSPGKMNFVENDEALRKWLAKGQGSLQCRVMSEEDLEHVEFFEEIRAWVSPSFAAELRMMLISTVGCWRGGQQRLTL